jgi:tRNA nucleotidyltransferase (CCA-adding enzyme)
LKKYLVGGAVRDLMLGKNISDKDYVVVGSSFEEMLSLGFKSVGKSFPVFIHPQKEGEFALARTEKKSGKKHFDFECFTKDVSLEEDLKRRDLTINAIAYDEDNDKFIDPFGGLEDIKNAVLRPTSEAFKDDALRILRAARFKTELGGEWKFDENLITFARQMKEELKELSRERVYKETKKALCACNSSVFFYSLFELDALDMLFPFLYNLTKISHNNEYHKEGSVFVHTMMALDLCCDINAKWAVLFHDAGKYQSFLKDGNFHRHCDEKIVKSVFANIQKLLSLSREEFEISKFFAINHHRLQIVLKNGMRASKTAALLFRIKDEKRLNAILEASFADLKGRVGKSSESDLFFSKEEIIKLWELLRYASYGVDNKTMGVERIKSQITHEQAKIVKSFIKSKIDAKSTF